MMEYRTNRRTGDRISIIGLGTSSICDAGEKKAVDALLYAHDKGVNYIDLATAKANTFRYVGTAFSSCRSEMLYQVHFGANYESGEYGWTTALNTVMKEIEWQLKELRTDYIDYGFIHCLDAESDWEAYQKNGVLDYLLKMKDEGVVHHIGLSSHTPKLANAVLDTGLVDQLMFSINPSYDYQRGEYANGSADERMALYQRCEKDGVGISVMKPFSGSQLLKAETSPFGKALGKFQCIQYALDKPGVLTVLPGVRSKSDVEEILGFIDAGSEEKDYSEISSLTPESVMGKCVYCNHCQPCPKGLNVGLINKYYDLAVVGDKLAADHYMKLEKKASDCISCSHCDRRCPFKVKQSERMKKIASYFGV